MRILLQINSTIETHSKLNHPTKTPNFTTAQTMLLDFDKPLSKLPPSHTWPLSSVRSHPCDSVDIPIIDLANSDIDQIRRACEEWGFFTVINHGVSNKLSEEFKTEIERLFALPTEVKLRARQSPEDSSGYGGVPVERFAPNGIWHEGFGIRNSLRDHASKLWPPHGNPNFCRVMEEYQTAMKTVAEKVLSLMLASVGLTPNDTNWAEPKTQESPFGPCGSHFHLNSYPPCPDPARAMGMTPHTDTCIVTVLRQVNDVNGLQVLHKDTWVNVNPIPGSLVINCGDLAHFFFNGAFVSPVHRVLPARAARRYSAAYLYGPPFGAPVAPLPKLVGPGRPPRYRTVTWEGYIKAKYELLETPIECARVEHEEMVQSNN